MSYYKILLFISVSRCYLQDTEIRYCPFLVSKLLSAKAEVDGYSKIAGRDVEMEGAWGATNICETSGKLAAI